MEFEYIILLFSCIFASWRFWELSKIYCCLPFTLFWRVLSTLFILFWALILFTFWSFSDIEESFIEEELLLLILLILLFSLLIFEFCILLFVLLNFPVNLESYIDCLFEVLFILFCSKLFEFLLLCVDTSSFCWLNAGIFSLILFILLSSLLTPNLSLILFWVSILLLLLKLIWELLLILLLFLSKSFFSWISLISLFCIFVSLIFSIFFGSMKLEFIYFKLKFFSSSFCVILLFDFCSRLSLFFLSIFFIGCIIPVKIS